MRILTKEIKYELPSEVSVAAKEFLKYMLEFEPAKRPSAGEALASRFFIEQVTVLSENPVFKYTNYRKLRRIQQK